MSQAIVARDRDNDIQSSNIKDGVEIFGVEGTYEGEIPVSSGIYTYSTDSTFRVCTGIELATFNIPKRAFEYGDYIYAIFIYNGGTEYITYIKIHKITKIVTYLYGQSVFPHSYTSLTSVKLDGDIVYINRDGTYNIGFDVSSDTYIGEGAGEHSGGDTVGTSVTIGGIIYTPVNFSRDTSSAPFRYQHLLGFKIGV